MLRATWINIKHLKTVVVVVAGENMMTLNRLDANSFCEISEYSEVWLSFRLCYLDACVFIMFKFGSDWNVFMIRFSICEINSWTHILLPSSQSANLAFTLTGLQTQLGTYYLVSLFPWREWNILFMIVIIWNWLINGHVIQGTLLLISNVQVIFPCSVRVPVESSCSWSVLWRFSCTKEIQKGKRILLKITLL